MPSGCPSAMRATRRSGSSGIARASRRSRGTRGASVLLDDALRQLRMAASSRSKERGLFAHRRAHARARNRRDGDDLQRPRSRAHAAALISARGSTGRARISAGAEGNQRLVSYPTFLDWSQDSVELQRNGVRARRRRESRLSGWAGDGRGRVRVAGILQDRCRPVPSSGRTFAPEEELQSGADAVVLSHDLWVQYFNSDPHIVGRVVSLDSAAPTVIGVMPPGFAYPEWAQLWRPLGQILGRDTALQHRDLHVDSRAIGRLSAATADADERIAVALSSVQQRVALSYPEFEGKWTGAVVVPLKNEVVGYVRTRALGTRRCGRAHSPHRLRRISRIFRQCAARLAGARWRCASRSAPAARRSRCSSIVEMLASRHRRRRPRSTRRPLRHRVAPRDSAVRSCRAPKKSRSTRARFSSSVLLTGATAVLFGSRARATRRGAERRHRHAPRTPIRCRRNARDRHAFAAFSPARSSRSRSCCSWEQARCCRATVDCRPSSWASMRTTSSRITDIPTEDEDTRTAGCRSRSVFALVERVSIVSQASRKLPSSTSCRLAAAVYRHAWRFPDARVSSDDDALYVTASEGYLRAMRLRLARGRWFTEERHALARRR